MTVKGEKYIKKFWHQEVKRENFDKTQEDEHPWLLSYSDMFTLLFCMFVVLFSISFRYLDWGIVEQMLKVFSRRHEMSLPELYEKLKPLIKQYGLEETVDVQLTTKGVEISFKEKATFDKGEARLKPDIFPILTAIAKLLNEKGIDKRKVIVEGHSDSLPISTREFPSNWELSSARAGAVVRFMVEKGLDPKRFEAVGYADTRPKVEHTHPIYGQPENRRVVVVVSPEPYGMEPSRHEISVKGEHKPQEKKFVSLLLVESEPKTLLVGKQDNEQEKLQPETQQQILLPRTTVNNEIRQQTVQHELQSQKGQITPEQKRLMEYYFSLGQQKFKEGNYNAAIVYFKKVLEIDPYHKLSKLNIERAKKMLQK